MKTKIETGISKGVNIMKKIILVLFILMSSFCVCMAENYDERGQRLIEVMEMDGRIIRIIEYQNGGFAVVGNGCPIEISGNCALFIKR